MSHLMDGLMNYKRLSDRYAYVSQFDWYVTVPKFYGYVTVLEDDYSGSKKKNYEFIRVEMQTRTFCLSKKIIIDIV